MQRVVLAVLCATVFAACSTDESISETTLSASSSNSLLRITASIDATGNTRVDGLDATTFETGDTIGLYILNSDGDIYGDSISSINVPAVYDGSAWTILEDVTLTEDSAYVLGYYPYDKSNEADGICLTMDGVTDYLLSGNTPANNGDSMAVLTFNHMLTRITLSLSTSESLGSATLSAVGIKGDLWPESELMIIPMNDYGIAACRAIYEEVCTVLEEGELTTQEISCNGITISSSEKTDINILVYSVEGDATCGSIVLTVNGSDYEVSLANSSITEWKSGCQYTYPITIDVTEGATLDVSDITGTYSGTMNVSLNSITLISGEETTVEVTEIDDSNVTISWSGSITISNTAIPISVDCDCSATFDSDSVAIEGSTTMDITTLGYYGLSVAVEGTAYAAADSLSLTISISSVNAVVEFNGVKGTDSSADDTSDDDTASSDTTYINGYAAVDLGLSVKWATMNVGAESPEDYGNYYAWGETETKSTYSSLYSVTYGVEMDDIAGDAEYDAATANWGSSWRMPTEDECQELVDSCTWTWTTENDINGYLVTGSNGNSIFLPAAGRRDGTMPFYVNSRGEYWSSTPYSSNADCAYFLSFRSSYLSVDTHTRQNGYSVRPVSE